MGVEDKVLLAFHDIYRKDHKRGQGGQVHMVRGGISIVCLSEVGAGGRRLGRRTPRCNFRMKGSSWEGGKKKV